MSRPSSRPIPLFVALAALALAAVHLLPCSAALPQPAPVASGSEYPGLKHNFRPSPANRTFVSLVVDNVVANISSRMKDKELALLFEDCLPNTLDTTVNYTLNATTGIPDTFIITGDITAMWLRDSVGQVRPYFQFIGEDEHLRSMIEGLLRRQTSQILLDPYANAYNNGPTGAGWQTDTRVPHMQPELFEGKYELDSLAAFLHLANQYFKYSADKTPFDATWISAVQKVLEVVQKMQETTMEIVESPNYLFMRETTTSSDTQPNNGLGVPGRRCGLSRSPFRPSDDSAHLPFPIAANAMMSVELNQLSSLLAQLPGAKETATIARRLSDEISEALHAYGKTVLDGADTWAYEVDGYGNSYFMDDANVPSLLSLPYLGFLNDTDAVYLTTRARVLSDKNPYFFEGSAGEGVGGPHVGLGWIWHMGIVMRAMTSTDDEEITYCLDQLKSTTIGMGFMHESFWYNDAKKYTRHWFAWCNSMFGELILKLDRERPWLLYDTNADSYSTSRV